MSLSDFQVAVVCYGIAINVVAFLAFAWDKHCARNQYWRVSEHTLLTLTFVGGTFGVLFGRWILRHKTRKQPFVTYLRLIISAQAVLLVPLSFPQGRHALWWAVQAVIS